MKISIGSDHGGFHLKTFLISGLSGEYQIEDCGTYSEESCDYPDFAEKTAKAVSSGKSQRGILICKSGLGMSIVANKFKGIRAALCRDVESIISSRKHNDANILVFGADFTEEQTALTWVKQWLLEDFEAGRHQRRLDKISEIEKKA